ncbi:MAG: hypothetical protein AAFY76_14405 [Cyanobacteria bacterium J06649_11]
MLSPFDTRWNIIDQTTFLTSVDYNNMRMGVAVVIALTTALFIHPLNISRSTLFTLLLSSHVLCVFSVWLFIQFIAFSAATTLIALFLYAAAPETDFMVAVYAIIHAFVFRYACKKYDFTWRIRYTQVI